MFRVLLLTYCVLFLFSCASDSMQEIKVATVATEEAESAAGGVDNISAIEISIETLPENLSTEQQKAFQLRAKQKFQDFIDYVQIISNPKIDEGLVNHTEKLMKELFISDKITITDSTFTDPSESTISLTQFIQLIKNHPKSIHFKTNDIIFAIPLIKDSTNNYKGTLRTSLIKKDKTKIMRVDVYLVETKKQFGVEEQNTIEIKLGNIY